MSEDEDDDFLFANERDVGDDVVMIWAKVSDIIFYNTKLCNIWGLLIAGFNALLSLYNRRIEVIYCR